jgi:DNA-directed DNA polymerase III PolC
MHLTHLHVHSHYSLLAATPSLAALVQRAADEGMTHLALTDTFALYGAVSFRRVCRTAGIQPIIGMTVKVTDPLLSATGTLVLLAKNPAGYRSLCRLSSRVQNRPDREEKLRRGITWAELQAHSAGLICIDGGLAGWPARLWQQGDRPAAVQYLTQLAETFADAYVALEIHRPADEELAQTLVSLGRETGLPAVAVQPVTCLDPRERETLRLLAAIDQNTLIQNIPPLRPVRYWLSPAEMKARFARFPQALECIAEIVAQCGDCLPEGTPIWPALSLPHSPAETLTQQASSGLKDLFPRASNEVKTRLDHELTAIITHGFAPLFLVVADIVRFARMAKIPVSTRGSVADSLVAYCLGITDVDPVAHDLLFERFLNPARTSLPDIDLDFCSRRRDEVLAYVRRTYGPDHVALVATVSTLQARSAVRETAKAHGYEEAEMKRLNHHLPRGWHPDPRRRNTKKLTDLAPELSDARDRLVFAAAAAIVGQPHHLSVHPGGLVITPGPLTDHVPVQLAPKGFSITQYDHIDVEAIGLPKLDLLGIRALTVLADAVEKVQAIHDPALTLESIPAADEQTGRMLTTGETIGVFQCESTGAQRTLRQLQARNVADLAVANAFFKPGPATGGMAQAFIRRYRGEEPVTYLHPALEPILAATKGVLLFQEQILRVARDIAGVSWAQADRLRKGMSKFRPEEMEAIANQFQEGCRQKGLSASQADTLWTQVRAFAGYGFNQGHATAYAAISYRSAYLKAHWPAAFLWARLVNAGGFHHPAIYLAEAVRLGCSIRPPHINVSHRRMTLTDTGNTPTLWMGLGRVRDLRRKAVQAIIGARPFSSLRDLLIRVSLREKEVRHLIQCGALDGLGSSRAALLAEARQIDRSGSAGQMALPFLNWQSIPRETLADRLAWERQLLGQPVSAHPLRLVTPLETAIPIRTLPDAATRPVTVQGVRLPGWTGGKGFFLSDETNFVVAQADGEIPPVWEPASFTGRWRKDAWGGGRFQVERIQ